MYDHISVNPVFHELSTLAILPYLSFFPSAYAVGNNFSRVSVCVCVCVCVCLSVCLSICLSVHLSVCVSVQVITFEPLKVGTSFLVPTYIFIISRSSLSTKVIRSRLRSND